MQTTWPSPGNVFGLSIFLGLALPSLSQISWQPGIPGTLDWIKIRTELKGMLGNKFDCRPENYLCQSNGLTPGCTNPDIRCDCNDQCMKYGGCCIDAADEKSNRGQEPDEDRFMCGKLGSLMDSHGIVMVKNCHQSFAGKNTERSCLQQVDLDAYDHLLDLPVISVSTNTTYINYYCAECNEDARYLAELNYDIECTIGGSSERVPDDFNFSTFLLTATYVPGSRMWDGYGIIRSSQRQFTSTMNITCQIKNIIDENVHKAIKTHETQPCKHPSCETPGYGCENNEVRECDLFWESEDDSEKCRSYSLPIYVEGTTYKNPHCALCNWIDMIPSFTVSCDLLDLGFAGSKFPVQNVQLYTTTVTYSTAIPDIYRLLLKPKSENSYECNNDQFRDPISRLCMFKNRY